MNSSKICIEDYELEIHDEEVEKIINVSEWRLDDHIKKNINETTVLTEDSTINDGSSNKVALTKQTSSKDQHNTFKFKGFNNLGNTWYMNSFLQALFMTEGFRFHII